MDNKELNRLLKEASSSQKLESLIEKFGSEPETVEKAHYDYRAARARLDKVKNEKEALEANERVKFYRAKVKEIDLVKKQRNSSPFSESAAQKADIEDQIRKATNNVREKKEEVDEMIKDPLAIVKEEDNMTPVADDTLIPLSKDGVTVIKFGADQHGSDKQQLEPKVMAPDPEKDPEFDGPADDNGAKVTVVKMEIEKEGDSMENKEPKIVFAESMKEIFRILREEESSPMVGEAPAVQSQESEVKPEEQKLPAEPTVEVSKDAQPEVLVTDTSIRIEIPVFSGEKPAENVSGEAGEAMMEALRVVYEILGGKKLNENEDGSVQVPADAQAEVKVEGNKLIIEIPAERPVEEVSKQDSEALKEAALVLASVLKEELGDAAAHPVATSEVKPSEHTPEVKKDEVHAGEQKAEEVKAPIIESKGVEAKSNIHDNKRHVKAFKATGVYSYKDGSYKRIDGTPATKEEIEKYNKTLNEADETSAVPTVEETGTVPQPAEGQESVEVSAEAQPEITVSDSSIRIEIPIESSDEIKTDEVPESSMEKISESLASIAAIFSSGVLKENDSVEVPADAEAKVEVEGDKLVIEIPASSPKGEVTEEEMSSVMESVQALTEIFGFSKEEKRKKAAEELRAKELRDVKSFGTTSKRELDDFAARQDALRNVEYFKAGKSVAPVSLAAQKLAADKKKVGDYGFLGRIPILDRFSGAKKAAEALQQKRIDAELARVSGLATSKLADPKYAGFTFDSKTGQFVSKAEQDLMNQHSAGKITADQYQNDPIIKNKIALQTEFEKEIGGNAGRLTNLSAKDREQRAKELYKSDYEKKQEELRKAKETAKAGLSTNLKTMDDAYAQQAKDREEAIAAKNVAVELKKEAGEFDRMAGRGVSESLFHFDVKAAESLVEQYEMDPEDRAQFVADLFEDVVSSRVKTRMGSLGFALNEAGLSRFIAETKISLSEEEKKSLFDIIDSEKISKDLSDSNELQASQDLEKNEVDNSKREEGNKKAEELAAPVTEGVKEFVGSLGKGVKDSLKQDSDYIKGITGTDGSDFVSKAVGVLASPGSVVKGAIAGAVNHFTKKNNSSVNEESPAKPEHSVDQQYDVHAALKVDMNPAKHDKEHDIKVDSADHKAEPKDVTVKDEIKPGEEAEYRSLKEAFLLEEGYFEKPSVSTVTPEQKQDKLVNQISLLVARESADPLYEELLNATAVARQIQTELQEKYKPAAKKKAKQLIDSKSKKPETTQASSLKLAEAIKSISSGGGINEGILDWVKGKLLMTVVGALPNATLDRIIMKAHTKALSMTRSSEERKAVEKEFTRYLEDRRDKVEFIKSLIKNAPEKDKVEADEKIKAVASKKMDGQASQQVNASAEIEDLGLSQLVEEPVISFLLAGGIIPAILNVIIGIVLTGVTVAVTKIIGRIRASIEDPYGDRADRNAVNLK